VILNPYFNVTILFNVKLFENGTILTMEEVG